MISSIANPTIKRVRRLRKAMWRERTERFLVEGHRGVDAALQAGASLDDLLYVSGSERARAEVLARAKAAGLAPVSVSRAVMQHLTSATTTPDLLAVAQRAEATPTSIDARALPLLVAAGVKDPATLGGVMATAAATGFPAVVVTRGTTDVFAPKVVRAAHGAHFQLRIVRVTDAGSLLARVGARVVALDPKGTPFWDADLAGPLALAVGDDPPSGAEPVSVPSGPVGPSLSARTAVVMYEWKRQNGRQP